MAEIEYQVVTDEVENENAVNLLYDSLNRLITHAGVINLGFPGGNVGSVTAKYDKKAGLWWHDWLSDEDAYVDAGKYWNNFGVGEPPWNRPIAPTVQFNISKQYAHNGRRVNGAMVKDNDGIVYLAHTGRLGGGNTKAGFADYYFKHNDGWMKLIDAKDNKGDRELILITAIDGPDVSRNIADYVKLVEKYKQGPGKRTGTPHDGEDQKPEPEPVASYAIKDIINEGCFLEEHDLKMILNRLKSRKNLILQGPPGTGKTYLAKRLGFALLGHKSDSEVRQFQFHPGMAYEDFVRGWRPVGDGKLELRDGPLLEAIVEAQSKPNSKVVIVIEEINRGNPANVLGEMLTLLEADKRKEDDALALSYPRDDNERVYVPDNLYVIGTMNVADRSLALLDFALRRRFAFYNLEPIFGDSWRRWVRKQCGISDGFLRKIAARLDELNETISEDKSLGARFKIGHSYVTPSEKINDPDNWFNQVVETEIGPLLDEYWFDDPDAARSNKNKLRVS